MNDVLTFDFPPFVSPQIEEVATTHELKQILQQLQQQQAIGAHVQANYKIFIHKEKYLYANCYTKGCRASLRYRLSSFGRFTLTKANLNHNHSICRGFKDRKFRSVVDFMKQLPQSTQASTMKKIICQQFDITQAQFYYLHKKAKYPAVSLEQLIRQLEDSNYDIVVSSEYPQSGNPPQILVASSPKMRQNFKLYGEVVMFDLTFNMVKNNHQSEKKWKVGCFVGVSACKHIVPFGLVMTLNQTKQTYVQILRTFFSSMKETPKVIITDQQKALLAAIEQLRTNKQYQGIHLLDAYHILKNVRKHLKVKQHISLFRQLIHARNQEQFKKFYKIADRQLHPEQKLSLERFMRYSDRYCFSKIKATFFGFTASTSNERLHNLIKTVQSSAKEYAITLRTILQYLEQLENKIDQFHLQKTPYEDLYRLPELKVIRYIFSKPIFSVFLDQFAKSICCEVIQSSGSHIYVKEGSFYQLTLDQDEQYNCTCMYKQKTALPCRHIIRLLILKKLPLLNQIPKRWRANVDIEKSSCNIRKIPLGRERLSRRNRAR